MTGLHWTREFIRLKRGIMQIMVGRPRKKGRREANGRIQRVYINPKAQVAAQPHRADVPRQSRELPEAESEFGRLMLRGVITPAQYEAGKRYAMLAARWRSVKGYPPIHPVAMDLLRSGGGVGADAPDHVIRAAIRDYDAAFCACEPHKVQRAVAHHVVFERKIDDFGTLDLVKIGLDKLIVHFHINPQLTLDRESRRSESRH
ncbi:MAG: hypothetical protein J0G33_02740 [Afipia felis]|nr:hypothetical protein [Afipia felis]